MITIKRGDTLAIAAAVTTDAGAVFDLTGYTLRSQVRSSSGALVGTATATEIFRGTCVVDGFFE